jgi:hypothetical protein
MKPQDGRQMLETMIQSSTVDLFHAAGIAVAPVAASRVDRDHLSSQNLMAMIPFDGSGASGTLALLVPIGVFDLVKQDPARPFTGAAWVQDSVNQLLGRLKTRLLSYQLLIQMGLPAPMDEKGLKQLMSQGILAAFRFRTLRGEVSVTLSGKVDSSKLSYTSQITHATEGDVLIF